MNKTTTVTQSASPDSSVMIKSGCHEGMMAKVSIPENTTATSLDESAASQQSKHQGNKCSACADCCHAAALLSYAKISFIVFFNPSPLVVETASFVTVVSDILDRPPRNILA
ncbi:MAG: hypothetical protein H0W44_00380 [Gammaproteobacteria bacterium]|nr:hypothetical protein [Gammaproteobacteria bacterium]